MEAPGDTIARVASTSRLRSRFADSPTCGDESIIAVLQMSRLGREAGLVGSEDLARTVEELRPAVGMRPVAAATGLAAAGPTPAVAAGPEQLRRWPFRHQR